MNAWLKMCRIHQHLAPTVTSEPLKNLSDSPAVYSVFSPLSTRWVTDGPACCHSARMTFSASFDSEHLYIFNSAHIAPLASQRWLTCLFLIIGRTGRQVVFTDPGPETPHCFKTKLQSLEKLRFLNFTLIQSKMTNLICTCRRWQRYQYLLPLLFTQQIAEWHCAPQSIVDAWLKCAAAARSKLASTLWPFGPFRRGTIRAFMKCVTCPPFPPLAHLKYQVLSTELCSLEHTFYFVTSTRLSFVRWL